MKNIVVCLSLILFLGCHNFFKREFSEKQISFINKLDGTKLSGTLALPSRKGTSPAVVLIHGSGPHTRDLDIFQHKPFKDLSHHLASNGTAVLRYDKRGCGQSGGDYVPYDMENFTNDALAGMDFLANFKSINATQIGLIGLSQGGLIAPTAAVKNQSVAFIVMLAGPGIWGKEFFYASQLAMTRAAGFSDDKIAEMKKVFKEAWHYISTPHLQGNEYPKGIKLLKKMWSFIDDESRTDFGFIDQNAPSFFDMYRQPNLLGFYSYDPHQTLSRVKCPVLAMNGDKDVQVTSKENLAALKKALADGENSNYKIIELPNHNHLFQKCQTGKISEYKKVPTTFSDESLTIISEWINTITQ